MDSEILSLYQDGSLETGRMREVDEHLQACEACQQKFRELGRAGLFLRIGMASRKQADCLGEEELGAYLSGRMGRRDRARVEGHLLICQRCLSEVSALMDCEMLAPSAESPAPDPAAIERMVALALNRRPVVAAASGARRPVFGWSLSLAAAAMLALALGLSWQLMTTGPTPIETSTPVVAKVPQPVENRIASSAAPEPAIERLELISDATFLQPDGTDLAAFAREMGVVLVGIQNLERRHDARMLEILQEDVLHSGLVNALARLSESVRDDEERRFLANCRDVLMRLVRLDGKTLAGELPQLLKDIRETDLIENARLLELERGTTPWLASL